MRSPVILAKKRIRECVSSPAEWYVHSFMCNLMWMWTKTTNRDVFVSPPPPPTLHPQTLMLFISFGWRVWTLQRSSTLPHGLASQRVFTLSHKAANVCCLCVCVAYGINTDSQPITIHPSNVTEVYPGGIKKKWYIRRRGKNSRQHFACRTVLMNTQPTLCAVISHLLVGHHRRHSARRRRRVRNRVDCEQFMRLSIHAFYFGARKIDAAGMGLVDGLLF